MFRQVWHTCLAFDDSRAKILFLTVVLSHRRQLSAWTLYAWEYFDLYGLCEVLNGSALMSL